MSEVINEYYKKTKLDERHIKRKVALFDSNNDIKQEFEYWIKNGEFVENGVEVEGCTAKSLSMQSKFLEGEGAFVLLIELRQNPDKAIRMIKEGFKLK